MRILHVVDKISIDGVNPSSVARLFAYWHSGHDPETFEIEVAVLRKPSKVAAFLEQHGIVTHFTGHHAYSPLNILALRRLVREREIDLLHLHGYGAANYGRIASWICGVPNVMHEHAILDVKTHQYIADYCLSRLTGVAVAVSGAVRDFVVKGRATDETKVRVIWNGVPKPRAVSAEEVAAFKAAQGLDDTLKLVGAVTRFNEIKGNRYLIDAAAMLVERDDRIRILLVGDGAQRGELEAQAKDLGVSGNVIFTGFLDDVKVALAAMDVVVIPSLSEGMPLAMLEAQLSGKPVVATAVGGMKEIAVDGDTALLVPVKDGAALARGVLRLLEDDDLSRKISAAGAAAAEAYTVERNVQALEALYSELTRG